MITGMDKERISRFLLQSNVPTRVIWNELIGASESRLKDMRKSLDLPSKVGQAPVPATTFSTVRGRLEAGMLIQCYKYTKRTNTGLWRRVDLMAMVASLDFIAAVGTGLGVDDANSFVKKLTPDHAHCVLVAYEQGQIEFHKCTHRRPATQARCGARYPVLTDFLPYPSACPVCESPKLLPGGADQVKLPAQKARNTHPVN